MSESEVEGFRREFMQFEKRYEADQRGIFHRLNALDSKVDRLPWLLLGVLVNLLLTLVGFILAL